MDVNRLVFVDETGATTAMSRTYGRAPEGERVPATKPGAWKKVTLISGLRTDGVVPSLAVPGSANRNVFDVYVKSVLVPTLRKGDVVIWDNLSIHGSTAALKSIKAVGAQVIPLPVYSPDLTPIEEMFSKVKSGLRTIAARTVDKVITAMGKVLNAVTTFDIQGWCHDRSPYAVPV